MIKESAIFVLLVFSGLVAVGLFTQRIKEKTAMKLFVNLCEVVFPISLVIYFLSLLFSDLLSSDFVEALSVVLLVSGVGAILAELRRGIKLLKGRELITVAVLSLLISFLVIYDANLTGIIWFLSLVLFAVVILILLSLMLEKYQKAQPVRLDINFTDLKNVGCIVLTLIIIGVIIKALLSLSRLYFSYYGPRANYWILFLAGIATALFILKNKIFRPKMWRRAPLFILSITMIILGWLLVSGYIEEKQTIESYLPRIYTLSPRFGVPGTRIIIRGKNFGVRTKEKYPGYVVAQGENLLIEEWTDKRIIAKTTVPIKSGDIYVVKDYLGPSGEMVSMASNKVPFYIIIWPPKKVTLRKYCFPCWEIGERYNLWPLWTKFINVFH